ncbi:DUF3325 domain-containing protein [Pseudoalteromonas sp. NEC-BIFX-2020_002]|uniref:DUF3325 domain-containing protein n=1 Tax=Pseudoalteromonas sp. NEC-BIFX-2020_002 TaxID=2732353 RepID=UPI0014776A95|nr:DUF3325 domain-containing protein [Pseudoalteromonas sp. NEC-BIFX-2020_002]NNG41392.1 DUF3325 domain-containing protein [Pseudoalteromonas sp. NEC-BIFX-2020_002]
MLILAQILLQLIGFALLSLSIPRHFSQVFQHTSRPTKRTVLALRCGGYAFVILAVIIAVNSWGVSLGLVYSVATATLTATTLTVLLAYISKLLTVIGRGFIPTTK